MPQDLRVAIFYDGVWNNVPTLSGESQCVVTVGPNPDTGDLEPSALDVTINNDTLAYDPDNVASPLYGKIGRNTPVRVSIGTNTLMVGEASAWRPDRTAEHVSGANRGKAWVDIRAEGVLRRIGKWTDPVRPPFTRVINGYHEASELLGYFEMSDGTAATQISNLAPGGVAAQFTGDVTLQGNAGPTGSDRVVQMGAAPNISGVWARPTGNLSGWQVSFCAKLDTAPPSATFIEMLRWQTTAGHIYLWSVNNTSFRVEVVTADGTSLVAQNSLYGGGVDPAKWICYRFKITDIGTQVQIEPAWYPQDGSAPLGFTTAFTAANPGLLVDWRTQLPNAGIGHLFATSSVALDITSVVARASFNGYVGETAGARINRLLTQDGLVSYYLGDIAQTPRMGRQPAGTLLELLAECVRTDAGFMYDDPFSVPMGVTYVTRGNRQGAAPVVAFTYPTHITPPLSRTSDDTGVANDVTASNPDRGSANVVLAAGPLSVLPPPAGIGRVRREVLVNLEKDSDLPARAQYELGASSLPRPRYPALTIDLLANPGLITTPLINLRPGDIVSVTGLEPEVVRLTVWQVQHVIGHTTRLLILRCTPAEIYDVAFYDTAGSIYDTASTTLAAGATSTATSLSLTTARDGDQLPTSGFPYSLTIAGERVTVTGMTAPAGTGPYTQTATVTRSANGVVKAQLINAEVHISYPKRYA